MKIRLSAVTEMMMSLPSSGLRLWCTVLGSSTGTPLAISGVTTMKMMSNTSTTSTSGVTLMFAITLLFSRGLCARACLRARRSLRGVALRPSLGLVPVGRTSGRSYRPVAMRRDSRAMVSSISPAVSSTSMVSSSTRSLK